MVLNDEAATAALGARIATLLERGDVVALSGELGAGKTALARSILRELGVEGHIPSPTFTLVQAYDTAKLTVHHFDFYRIEKISELPELGLEEALEYGAVLIEWPERGLPKDLAKDALFVALTAMTDTIREARLTGSDRWLKLLGKGGAHPI